MNFRGLKDDFRKSLFPSNLPFSLLDITGRFHSFHQGSSVTVLHNGLCPSLPSPQLVECSVILNVAHDGLQSHPFRYTWFVRFIAILLGNIVRSEVSDMTDSTGGIYLNFSFQPCCSLRSWLCPQRQQKVNSAFSSRLSGALIIPKQRHRHLQRQRQAKFPGSLNRTN